MRTFLLVLFTLAAFAYCAGAEIQSSSKKLQVVATTTILADVVSQVGGDRIEISSLLPAGADPHNFEPTPADAAKLAQADAVFMNGLSLEAALEPLLKNVDQSEKITVVSEGIIPLSGELSDGEDHGMQDPHVWTDPNNVKIWVNNIEETLSKLDSSDAQTFRDNAATYEKQLRDLDEWIWNEISKIRGANRMLVTDHLMLGYFAAHYGFRQIGAIIPGYSTLSQPSARELAALEDALREHHVKAIFVGNTVNPSLARRVSEDTGSKLVTLYTGALTDANGAAPTYIDYMKSNVTAIVSALK